MRPEFPLLETNYFFTENSRKNSNSLSKGMTPDIILFSVFDFIQQALIANTDLCSSLDITEVMSALVMVSKLHSTGTFCTDFPSQSVTVEEPFGLGGDHFSDAIEILRSEQGSV